MHKQLAALTLALMALPMVAALGGDLAQARHGGHHVPPGQAKKMAYFNGYGNQPVSYYRDGVPFFRTKTGKIVKGALIGGGIGAATGVVLDKPVLKSGVIGAAVGAGVQAVRYSDW